MLDIRYSLIVFRVATGGYIQPDEIVGFIGFSEGTIARIICRLSGSKTTGYIDVTTFPSIASYSYGTITAWDYLANAYRTHHTYYMNRSVTIYDAGGVVWGSVAVGQQVAAKDIYDGQNGTSNSDWLQINYVRSTSGTWVAINNAFGFVPIGLEYGSMSTTANIKGTW